MENSNSLGGARIALLIDFDNVILGIDDPGFDVELVVNALRERGTITVSRVYGDWYRHSRHRRHLMEHGLELVEAPAFGPVIKNSADIKIALDGYEIGMTMPHINTFCLVSGDSDFLPLIKKLQGLGKNVLVICGNRFTSDMLRRNCNEFISYENLLAASYGADEDATTLEGAFALLHRAMAALRERGSEIRTSTLKQMMIQLNPVFSEKTFGYNQFRGFLDKAGRENLIKLGPRDRVSGEFYVLLPDEDEAEVIEQIERAEPAQIVENAVEARRGGRNRRGGDNHAERNGAERNGVERNDNARDNRRDAPAATEAQAPRVSRREARLQALREQEELEQQAPASQTAAPVVAPLASPLTPATDFSPADETEAREKSIARAELLRRGLRVGRVKFSGKTGRAEAVARTESQQVPEASVVEPDIALTPEDVEVEAMPVEIAGETATDETPEATPEIGAETASEKPKRGRSRRRKKTPEATIANAEVVESENASEVKNETPATDAATPTELAPANGQNDDENAGFSAEISESANENDAAANEDNQAANENAAAETLEFSATETQASAEKKPRRRRTARKKAEATSSAQETTIAQEAATGDENSGEVTPVTEPVAQAEPPKTARTRRRKKTEETTNEMEKAILPDGTQQTVSTETLIAASANTPAAQKPKSRSRKTARKLTEEAAGVKSAVDEKIVTTEETTGEVTPAELAQIPVPVSEDEL